MPRKKPTIKQIAKVINNLIVDFDKLRHGNFVNSMVFDEYVKFKKDDVKFKKHMEKIVDEKNKRVAEDRAIDSSSDNKQ